MKKSNSFFATIIISILLSSCGADKSIELIKLIPVKNGDEYQYINQEGKIIINPQFSKATIFRDELALVRSSGDEPKWGFITDDGKYAISPTYKDATVFNEGLAWVVLENGAPSAIDKTGEIQFTLQDVEKVEIFMEDLAGFSQVSEDGETKWGFVDKTGKVIINTQFSEIGFFSKGKCPVKNSDGKWGYIGKDGKIIINYQFDYADRFENNKAVVTSEDKKGVIDKEGKYLINPQYSSITIDGDLLLVRQDDKYGWCDKDGKFLINPQFEKAYPFHGNKITAVESGDKWGFIDKEGKITINPQFEQVLPFNGKIAVVANSEKIGFIDKEGKYVVNPQYDDISDDYVEYILTGFSDYSSVVTDFFNVSAIISVINFDSPEGFSFNSTFEDVMKKFEINESKFSKRDAFSKVLISKKISNDASYDFYVVGNAYDQVEVQKGSSYYRYTATDYTFNGKNKPTSFAYSISLSGKGYGKQELVIKAIQDNLSTYKKDDKKSGEEDYFYNNGKNEIRLVESEGNIWIVISELNTEDNKYEEGVEEEETDVTEVEEKTFYKIQDPDGYTNLRASTGGEIIRKVYPKEKFEIIATDGKYNKVKFPDNETGYIHKSRIVKY